MLTVWVIACKDDKGEWVLINGNQTCMMYLYYILTQYKQLGKIKGGEFCVKTIVTTELIKKIADKNNIEMLDCYTGFKWIAREIRLREGKQKYIGGGEESYGFLAEDFVRDKDAVSACCLIAEVAAWAKDNGKSLYQLLLDIYVEYGFSKEFTVNVVKPGKSGAEEIEAMMLARPPMKESSRSSALHSPTEWAVCKLEKMDAADEQMRSHLRIVQLHEAIMRTLTDPEKWFVTKYYDEHYALATLPNLPDSPYRRAARSTMSNVKKRILSKADSFLTEMATRI